MLEGYDLNEVAKLYGWSRAQRDKIMRYTRDTFHLVLHGEPRVERQHCPLSAAEIATVQELVNRGQTIRAIAAGLGRSEPTVRKGYRQATGQAVPYRGRRPATPDELTRIRESVRQGVTYTQIAKDLGRSEYFVQRHGNAYAAAQ
jgi:DNA-binding NarL/FixJ family response regulator